MPSLEDAVSSSHIFSGRIISLQVDEVRLPSGRLTHRETVIHPGAVAVVALEGDKILLERQYRHTAKRVIWEIPAGTIEKGEAPEDCARRELTEETGYSADKMEQVFSFYVAPGYSTEIIHLFLARGLKKSSKRLDDDEEIDSMFVPLSKAVEMVRDNEIEDAKTAIGILFLDRFMGKAKG
ncbi:MAG: NUDIX hydrolase [Candidatus Verstraetearchaeota archaeon]|nr:NUDIX hydrolase [Candidatus Verstraetearchaeota archaeon]